jgi:hypothetical protein
MKIRLTAGREDWLKYLSYLDSVWSSLPPGTKTFVREEWFYEHDDHRCPHDAWLQDLRVEEHASGDRQQYRTLQIKIRLLGAYHDHQLEFVHKNVIEYEARSKNTKRPRVAHGDFLWNEIRYEEGKVVHELIFSEDSSWVIKCSDIDYSWIPLADVN